MVRGRWFAPGNLGVKALVDRVHGVYVPYWTFDAHAVCPWDAEAGHYYYTTERYRDNKGNMQTRQVRHVRWEPASGEVTHFFDDEPVPGTQGLRHDLLKKIEPFPTTEVQGYDTAYLSGFVVEHYQVVLVDAAARSQEADDGASAADGVGAGAGRHAAEPRRSIRASPARPSSTFWCRCGCCRSPTGRSSTRCW